MSINAEQLVMELYREQENCFDDQHTGPLFDEPLVAVASAGDEWFVKFKHIIGDFHFTPNEALGFVDPSATARSVISYALPIGETAREANRKQVDIPSRPWAYVRTYGEQMNVLMRNGLAQRLRQMGYSAAAPHLLAENKIGSYPVVGRAACWSERHVAFVAGLGTFGLSGGLITRRGVAHRLGSVVTDAEITLTARPYGDDPFAWCLKLAKGTCGACIKRCPGDSIAQDIAGRDKEACWQHTYNTIRGDKGLEIFGWKGGYGCGLCQTAVPCEDKNPTE